MRRAAAWSVAALAMSAAAGNPAVAQTTDTTAPQLGAATLDPPTYTGMRSPWYRGPVKVSFSATDDVAVTKLEYSLDNGETWIDLAITPGPSVTAEATITQEGNTTVRYRAFDAAGNVSSVPRPAANTTLNQPASAGATAIRLQSTNGRAAGDQLTIGTGADQETVTIESVITPNPASPNPNVNLTTALTKDHAAGTAIVVQPPPLPYGTVTVAIDTRPPVLDTALVAGPITPSSVLSAPPFAATATVPPGSGSLIDPSNPNGSLGSSGGTGLNRPGYVQMYLDGERINPAPINLYELDAGTHTMRAWVNDAAGNSVWYTVSFTISVAPDGTKSIGSIAQSAEPTDMPRQRPFVTPTRMTPNPDASYKVLIVSRTQGFRHNHIPDSIVAIQQLGAANGFNVDVFDPALPDVTLPTNPLTSAESLAQYKAVIFDSTTGNSNYSNEEFSALREYIRAGGGFVGIHAGTDCCRGTGELQQWYQAMVGGIFTGHPQGPFSLDPGCETCFWATAEIEDPTHPSTRHLPLRWKITDELYNLDRNARLNTHTLITLDEGSFAGNLNLQGGGGNMGDHPMTWCQNYDGGRAFTQVFGHLRELWYDTDFLRNILGGIQTAAGVVPANCVSHREVRELVAAAGAAGTLTAAAAERATELINSAYATYAPPQKNYAGAVAEIDALRTLAQQPENGDADVRAQLLAKANQLREWMLALGADVEQGTVSGTVPATLSLTLGQAPSFGAFTPGVSRDYETTGTATVSSTAGDAALSVVDPSAAAPGRLINGAYSLAQPLQVKASSAGGLGGDYGAVSGSPRTVLEYAGPISSDTVTLGFKQSIGAAEPLRTGDYSKTLTYTLSTTTP